MNVEAFVFYLFAAITVFAAIRVITIRNPVHAALFLVLTFVSSAALWILLQAEFLGLTLILVYVGAVMVLFLFVVMMLDINVATLRAGFIRYLPVGIVVAVLMAGQMIYVLSGDIFSSKSELETAAADHSNAEALGELIYTKHLYSFEIAAAILLIAIVAAIALTLRKKRGDTKYQTPSEQVKVRKSDRLRVVKMDTEHGEKS